MLKPPHIRWQIAFAGTNAGGSGGGGVDSKKYLRWCLLFQFSRRKTQKSRQQQRTHYQLTPNEKKKIRRFC